MMIEEGLIEGDLVEAKMPHMLKYMGSKREIIDFVTGAIEELGVESEWFCDLFSGTSVVGASLKGKYNIHTNDIQSYSAVLAQTYLTDLKSLIPNTRIEEIKTQATFLVNEFKSTFPELIFDYSNVKNFRELIQIEKAQQQLIDSNFNVGFHLFAKYYSGTYWSFEQCVWIDSIRCVAEIYKNQPEYYAIMSSLISAMSYVTQSTGHYAQFRDVTNENFTDILGHRSKKIWTFFERKFKELSIVLNGALCKEYKITTLDYLDCLRFIADGTIVYADPPYQAVHYSRFYHALETLVKYDYPKVAHKGRYREDRHQSPFCKKTTVSDAFTAMFLAVKARNSHLALSYSDTGLISLEKILELGNKSLGDDYSTTVLEKDHTHSKMGRSDIKQHDVTEYIILFKKIK